MPSYLTPGVYIEEVPSGAQSLSAGATAVAAFVGFTERAPTDDPTDPEGMKPRLVTNWTQFEELYGSFAAGCMLPNSVYGYFNNGGSMAYIVRIPNAEPAGEPAKLALPASDRALGQPLLVESKEPDADIQIVIDAADDDGDDDEPSEPTFRLTVLDSGIAIESFDDLIFGKGDQNVEKVVNAQSETVTVTATLDSSIDLTSLLGVLKPGTYSLEKSAPLPVPVSGKKFAGSAAARTGINGLTIADDVTMVLVPDLINAATKDDGTVDLGMWKAVQTALITHCELEANRMAVLDAPPGLNPQQMAEWRSDVAMYDSAFAAMYYPWIKVENPLASNGNAEMLVPPSGHLAGIWARNDETRGVWKAPANEIVRGALDVERNLTKAEQGLLNPVGVNCIRPFGTRGIRVWGGRTLSSDTDWQYINVRRLFNMVETTIMEGTQWVVFEPNDMKLWQGVSRTVSAFLRGLWREGALFGASADQAFFVKCDAETNPPDSIEQGKLVVEVGIAPVRPAEFVIFRISQFKDQSA